MKFRNLLSLLFAVLFASSSIAAVVQQDVATNVARSFMHERLAQKGDLRNFNEISVNLLDTRISNGLPAYYIFNMDNQGWVIVSAEDTYSPIIGYSFEGTFPQMKLDKNVSSFLQGYVDQIEFLRTNNMAATNETIEEWNLYSGIVNPRMLLDDRDVEPLIGILWNQDYPYNAYCPIDPQGPGGHVYAGCVATAMSMIMYHYRYPEVGTGSHSYFCPGFGTQSANFGETYYDWDAMQNTVTATMGQTVNAVAELQYHCGVAVDMSYDGVEGSGAFSQNVPAAIKAYFGYALNAQYVQKMGYTTTAWENLIGAQIDAKKPVYYSGQSTDGGHAFVCDGYQVTSTGKHFHFNFGWGGSGNGYYALNDVNGFSSQQGAVINFVPNSANYPYHCDDHIVNASDGAIEDLSGPLSDYLSNSACTWLISPPDSVSSITLKFSRLNLGENDSVKIYGGNSSNAVLLATYGKESTVAPLTSDTNSMFIEFITDGSDEGEGFRAEFNSIYPMYCSNGLTILTDPTGEFNDGSGQNKYNNNTVCKWKINPGPWAKDLTLTFTELDLEAGKDVIKVFEIPTNIVLGEVSGNTIPAPIVSSTGQMMLIFNANGFNNFQGFNAEYYISNVGTNDGDFAQNLSIYPNPATTYSDVKFNLNEPAMISISLYNLLGEEIYSIPSQLYSGFVSKTIQVGGLSKGVYLLKIAGDNGSLTKKLVVK